ncbi:TetR/AcrR family transcriptional regulator [Acinetobacter sp. ANC 4648]|uniref:TetR/AcrR family transcriptional regulator n=1 Tax=Acinetobacter sp. ANC 4648 TaxID=1977875 RepID=UPI000A339FEA|nr:TetR/AcrR family transcriptional regulator [Acinetobacter sp. ANC 4648]OTG82244.1 TetR family transcriptional regulator [Acinetobacter sp. ANC 4648]
MENAYQRKKEPELVRKRILDGAMQLAAEKGVTGVSIQAVATLAGITKGGVFHHFANKKILIEAMLNLILSQLDQEVDCMIAIDPEKYGCFTRAYIELTLTSEAFGVHSLWGALSMVMVTEQSFSHLWNHWLDNRLARHAATDQDMYLKILRYAADGAWFIERLDPQGSADFIAMKEELIQRSYRAM